MEKWRRGGQVRLLLKQKNVTKTILERNSHFILKESILKLFSLKNPYLIKLEFKAYDVTEGSEFTFLHVWFQKGKKEVLYINAAFKRVQQHVKSFVWIKIEPPWNKKNHNN